MFKLLDFVVGMNPVQQKLAVLLAVLKVVGALKCSWFAVTSPLWLPAFSVYFLFSHLFV